MKHILFLTILLCMAKSGYGQGLVNWEWTVDSNIVYYDLDYEDGFIYGVGKDGNDGIMAQKDTNGGTVWMTSLPDVTMIQLTLSEQHDLLGIGTFSGTITLNGNTYTSYGGKDVMVVRCDSSGNITLVKQFGSTGDDNAIDICVDHHGAFYIATQCPQPVTQSGNTFSGNLIAKFDSMGVAGFLHALNPESGPTSCYLVAIKYSRPDSTVVLGGNYEITDYSGSGPVYGSVKYKNGIYSTTISSYCMYHCKNVLYARISISGNNFYVWDITNSHNKTYFMTDAIVTDSAKTIYAQRYQFSLNGFTSNSWEKVPYGVGGYGIPNSDGNWGVNLCGSAYMWGQPYKLDYDSNYLYGTLYQPELDCGSYNCSSWYAVKVQVNPYLMSYISLNISPIGITGHEGTLYLGNYAGGLYKSCNNNCPLLLPLNVLPAQDITMCPHESQIIQQPPCFNIYGGVAPYTYSWQPTTGLSDPTISNPTVSGLTSGIYNYTLTLTDQNMNSVMDTITVTVLTPSNVTAIVTPSIPACGDSLLIVAGGSASYLIFWADIQNYIHYLNNDSLILIPSFNTNIYIVGTDQFGCKDTLVQPLNLISQIDTTHVFLCESQLPYSWYGLNYSNSGYYTKSFTNMYGCDSLKKLHLVAHPTDIIYDSLTICYNQLPYNWNGNMLYTVGTYSDTSTGLSPALGCDSITIFKLKIEPIISSLTASPSFVCIQDSSQLKIKSNADYCIPIVQYSPECISNFQFHTINNTTGSSGCTAYTYYQLNANVVAGMSYPFSISSYNYKRNIWIDFNRDGDFDDVGEMVYNLYSSTNTVNGNITIPTNAINGKTRLRVACRWISSGVNTPCYNNSFGEYEDYNITIAGGVDNIFWSPASGLNVTVGDSVVASPLNTTTYTVSVYSSSGCVKDTTIIVTIVHPDTTSLNQIICSSQLPYLWFGNNIISSGNYTHVLNNAYGCDSFLNLQVSILLSDSNSTSISICPEQLPFSWNGMNLTSAGNIYISSINSVGCDSISGLSLFVYPQPNAVINWNGTLLNTSSSFANYQWYSNGNVIAGATDSTYTPSQDGDYTVMVTDSNGCMALSSVYHFTPDAVSSIFTNHFSIYPNPADKQSTISFIQPFTGSLQLINSVGQIVFEQRCQGSEKEILHLANYTSGSYLIRFSTNEWTATVKLVVAR